MSLGSLSTKLQKAVAGALDDQEGVIATIEGLRSQGAVLTRRRIIVAKSGINAGAAFGAKVTSYPFDLVAAVEVQTSGVRTVLTIQSAGDRSAAGFLFQRQLGKDVWSSANTVPFNRGDREQVERFARQANEALAAATAPAAAVSAAPASVADELAKLAALQEAGVLSEEEFAAQKAKLLG